MTFVATLDPPSLWSHFDRILTIPRASKDEERIRQHVIDLARERRLDHQVDGAGNVIVRVPGTDGHDTAPVTILQSHLDMVQEKNTDVAHDFTTDAIVPQRQGDYLTATGTTLGSDNGIGVATMLAVMEATDLVHGPLELLFTIDEETGLTGAAQLDAGLLTGRQLINLDSEEEGILYVGCAGGGDTESTLPVTTAPVGAGAATLTLALRGLKGGHSGVDIHLRRGNAIALLVRALWAAYPTTPFRLARLAGGSAHNAIPREAFATLVVDSASRTSLVDAVEAELAAIREEYRPADPGLTHAIETGDAADAAWDAATTATALRFLASLPHGVTAMSYDIPDLVETSNNVATVATRDGALVVTTSTRSSIDAALEALRRQIRATAELAGARVDEHPAYPGWKPNLDSRLLEVVTRVHTEVVGAAPAVKAIHAGLECGIIGKKIPGMDMISFGPVIEFPHSPDERVRIDSVGRFYRLLTATLEALA